VGNKCNRKNVYVCVCKEKGIERGTITLYTTKIIIKINKNKLNHFSLVFMFKIVSNFFYEVRMNFFLLTYITIRGFGGNLISLI